MRNFAPKTVLSLLVAGLIYNPLTTQAQSIVPRSPSYSQADDQPIDNEDTVQSYFHANKSYECAIMTLDFATSSADEFYIFNTNVTDPDGSTIVAAANGNVYPSIAPVDGVTAVHNRTRVSLTAQKTGIYKFTVADAFNQNGSEASTIRCRETTLYGGYNRFFAGVVIIELNNASELDIDVTINVVNSKQETVVSAQQAVAKSNTRTDVIFSSLPASSFGQIKITHNAPYGALSGMVSEYDYAADGSISLKRERPLQNAQRR
jgi:hypothetical protein